MQALIAMPNGAHTSTKSMSFNVSPAFFRASLIAGTGPRAKICERFFFFFFKTPFQLSANV